MIEVITAEMWPLTLTSVQRLDATHDRWLVVILDASLKDRVTNKEVRAKTGQRRMDYTLSELKEA